MEIREGVIEHPRVSAGRFSADWREEGSAFTVTLRGWADLPEAVQVLGELWMQVHARALELDATEVLVDLRAMEFMSSSCYRTFVVWLAHLSDSEEGERYGIRFRLDARREWQGRGLAALSYFAQDLVSVEP